MLRHRHDLMGSGRRAGKIMVVLGLLPALGRPAAGEAAQRQLEERIS